MQNTFTLSGVGNVTLKLTNNDTNKIFIGSSVQSDSWLTSASTTINTSNYCVLHITNDFANQEGNFYLRETSREEINNYMHIYYDVKEYYRFVHDDDKARIDLEEALDNSLFAFNLKSNFQAGVDEIYNTIVTNGVTPAASTPDACAAGINQVATNKRAQGRSDIQNDTLLIQATAYTLGNSITVDVDIYNQSLGGIQIFSGRATDSTGSMQVNLNQTKSAKHSYTGRISQMT